MLEVMMQEKVLYGEVHNNKKKHHFLQDLLLLNLLHQHLKLLLIL